MQETLEAWLLCQAGWVYLEPIFGSEDIMQQMPNEGRKFRTIDMSWRLTMQRLKKNPEAITVAADAELLRSLQEANFLLEQVGRLPWSAGACSTRQALTARLENAAETITVLTDGLCDKKPPVKTA